MFWFLSGPKEVNFAGDKLSTPALGTEARTLAAFPTAAPPRDGFSDGKCVDYYSVSNSSPLHPFKTPQDETVASLRSGKTRC
jgi:hypothetical protein